MNHRLTSVEVRSLKRVNSNMLNLGVGASVPPFRMFDDANTYLDLPGCRNIRFNSSILLLDTGVFTCT